MLKKNSLVNREILGFKEEVLSTFSFLIEEYGFQIIETKPTFVRFESPLVFVNVYHGRLSSELGLEIGPIKQSSSRLESRYSLSDILDSVDKRKEENYTFFQASTKERVKKYVAKAAELVRKYGVDALKGDSATFERLRAIQAHNSQDYLKEIKLGRIRPKAEEAFRRKDYSKVVELLEPVRAELRPSELKKLEYSKKHLDSDSLPRR